MVRFVDLLSFEVVETSVAIMCWVWGRDLEQQKGARERELFCSWKVSVLLLQPSSNSWMRRGYWHRRGAMLVQRWQNLVPWGARARNVR